jgi:DNA-binding response OmpR family regulator
MQGNPDDDKGLYPSIAGKRILIIEDRYLLAQDLGDVLGESGAEIVGIASNLEDGVVHAHFDKVDFAILDVDLRGESVFSIADILDERQIPYLFATGVSVGDLPERFQHHQVVRKPFATRTVLNALEQHFQTSVPAA